MRPPPPLPWGSRRWQLYGESDKSRDPSWGVVLRKTKRERTTAATTTATVNTFDDLPVMIVFTFSSTTDSAESLLAMSSKSTYYPKPISGGPIIRRAGGTLRRSDSSAAVFFSSPPPRGTSYEDSRRYREISRQFCRATFTLDNRDDGADGRVNRTLRSSWQVAVSVRYQQ